MLSIPDSELCVDGQYTRWSSMRAYVVVLIIDTMVDLFKEMVLDLACTFVEFRMQVCCRVALRIKLGSNPHVAGISIAGAESGSPQSSPHRLATKYNSA